jgi:diguanylate cyclase (GGDEF)-like protein/PAS domain S-box-containing protein
MIITDRRNNRRRDGDHRVSDNLIQHYEFVLHHVRDIIFTVRERDRNILDANDAALITYQYTLDELRSMTLDDLTAADAQEQMVSHSDAAVPGGLPLETFHVRKNGEKFPVEVTSLGSFLGDEKVLLSVVRDLSERNQSQEAVRDTDNNLRALLNAVTETLLLLDKDGTVLAANDTSAKRLRLRIDNMIGANYFDLLPVETAEERRRQAGTVIATGTPVRFEDIRNKRCIDQVIYPVCDDSGEVVRLALFGADITWRREMEKELEAMALTDEMTGLYNRRGFFTLATRELKRAQRLNNGMLLFYADLDGLKEINDQYGHEEGDRALVAASQILAQTFRSSDIISRIGGDEFAILVVDADASLMEKLLLRLYRLINNHNARKTHRYKLAVSVGDGVYDPQKPTTLDELISDADQRMYKMKKIKYRR